MELPVTSANYDGMARYYDFITRAISLGGNSRAQRRFLAHIKRSDRVLHAGCGSVSFNEDLARACDHVVCVDISPRMVDLARRRLQRAGLLEEVELVCTDILQYRPDHMFDVVFANFFFNTFRWDDCQRVLKYLTGLVTPGGLFCIADEVEPNVTVVAAPQRLVRHLVTWLHHVWVDHPMHEVYDYAPTMSALGFRVIERRLDETGYIESTVYEKVK